MPPVYPRKLGSARVDAAGFRCALTVRWQKSVSHLGMDV
jgi:hypothetical protein